MDRRKRYRQTVALMSMLSETKTIDNVDIATFDGNGKNLLSLIVGIEPVQAGSGDPSPDNVRSISGWDAVEVEVAGENLLDYTRIEQINVSSVIGEETPRNGLIIRQAGVFTVSAQQGGAGDYMYVRLFNADGTGTETYNVVSQNRLTPCTFTRTDGQYFAIYDAIATNSLNTSKQLFAKWRVQCEIGTTASPYKPFAGNRYTIQLGDTVYGGTLDLTAGMLTVNMANIESYNGETLSGEWISDRDVYSAGGTPTIGAQVVYELDTPIIIHLDPVQISTIANQTNNVWADTGKIIFLEYEA